jgi:uncharacterized protein (DUF2141 family)
MTPADSLHAIALDLRPGRYTLDVEIDEDGQTHLQVSPAANPGSTMSWPPARASMARPAR